MAFVASNGSVTWTGTGVVVSNTAGTLWGTANNSTQAALIRLYGLSTVNGVYSNITTDFSAIRTDYGIGPPRNSGAVFKVLNMNYVISSSGTGSIIGIDYNPTITLISGSHYAALFRTGSVGIGLDTPIATLHVNGSTAFGGVTSSTSITLDSSKTYWGFTGSIASIWTFPPISGTVGTSYKVYNRGSGSSASVTFTGSNVNDMFYTGSTSASSAIISPGEKREVYNDGLYWIVFNI